MRCSPILGRRALRTLALLTMLPPATPAPAIMCQATASVHLGTLALDSESNFLAPVTSCSADASFQGVQSNQTIDGISHSEGTPGTTGPSGVNPPFALSVTDLTATVTAQTSVSSRAGSQYWYEFKICSISSGCPATPPPIPINVPVLLHYAWNLQATATGSTTASPVSIEHRLGFSDGTDITLGLLTQRITVDHLTLPGITEASIAQNCSEAILALAGSSCADARSDFFNQTGVLVPIQAGPLYQVKLITQVTTTAGSGSGSAHARAFIDPVIEIHPDFADEYEVIYAEGSIEPDSDGDGFSDSVDNCPLFATENLADSDGNGRGDACECGDQTEDGVVDILDILAINRVIFGLEPQSPLCDANNDGQCDILDILAANAKLFGTPAYCERFPPPDL